MGTSVTVLSTPAVVLMVLPKKPPADFLAELNEELMSSSLLITRMPNRSWSNCWPWSKKVTSLA